MVDASGEEWAGYTLCHKLGRNVSVFGAILPAEVEPKRCKIFTEQFKKKVWSGFFLFFLLLNH